MCILSPPHTHARSLPSSLSHPHSRSLARSQYQSLRKDADSLQEELDIANMDPKEAHTKFVARVNDFKQVTSRPFDRLPGYTEQMTD